jgi:hypothetical protein
MQSKVCTVCCLERDLESFYKTKDGKFGRHSMCKVCLLSKNKASREKTKLEIKSQKQAYYLANKESINEKNRVNYLANRQSRLETSKRWKKLNHHKVISSASLRKKKIRIATPKWLSTQHRAEIENFYWLAKDLTAVSGETYHVDHIVPLRGENVCGLHVPWNLQVLPADINLAKSNNLLQKEMV